MGNSWIVSKMLDKIVFFVFITGIVGDISSPARPCFFSDYKCLTDNIAVNSRCNRNVPGSIPNAYKIESFKFDTPYFNATYVDNDLVIRNHDLCRVSEFFFNVATDSALLSLDCVGLTFEAKRTLIQHYPRKQDTIYSYIISTYYPQMLLTVDIKNANKIDLCANPSFAYVPEIPLLNITPLDKPTASALTKDLSFLYVFAREEAYARANQLLRTYVNKYICDFGCNA